MIQFPFARWFKLNNAEQKGLARMLQCMLLTFNLVSSDQQAMLSIFNRIVLPHPSPQNSVEDGPLSNICTRAQHCKGVGSGDVQFSFLHKRFRRTWEGNNVNENLSQNFCP